MTAVYTRLCMRAHTRDSNLRTVPGRFFEQSPIPVLGHSKLQGTAALCRPVSFKSVPPSMTMGGGALSRQAAGSLLVNRYDTFTTLSGLLQVHRPSLKLTKLFGTDKWGWGDTANFHRCCDGKGPTITIVQRSDGRCYGGYASQSWTSTEAGYTIPMPFFFASTRMRSKCTQKQRSLKGSATSPGPNCFATHLMDRYLAPSTTSSPSAPVEACSKTVDREEALPLSFSRR
ncbi:TPA: hypothetical protein ACH3X1_012724 [Trebouxia sp. C0004]